MKCTFCGRELVPGTGTLYITKEGKKFVFCSSKCDKNQIKLGRAARNRKWTSQE